MAVGSLPPPFGMMTQQFCDRLFNYEIPSFNPAMLAHLCEIICIIFGVLAMGYDAKNTLIIILSSHVLLKNKCAHLIDFVPWEGDMLHEFYIHGTS